MLWVDSSFIVIVDILGVGHLSRYLPSWRGQDTTSRPQTLFENTVTTSLDPELLRQPVVWIILGRCSSGGSELKPNGKILLIFHSKQTDVSRVFS